MSQSRKETSTSSVLKSLFYGSMAGGAEVLIDHPFWTMKTRAQQKLPFTTNIPVLYRGLVPNMVSMMPITALQFGLNAAFKSAFTGNASTLPVELTGAFLSGVGAALVASPTERVMTCQTSGISFSKTARTMLQQGGVRSLYAGFLATALRDGGFTAGMFVGAPYLKAAMQPYFNSEKVAMIAGGVSAGLVVALATQAVDTVKTIQQSAKPTASVNMKSAVSQIHSENGMKGFFRGTLWRSGRVAAGVTIMNVVGSELVKRFG